MKQAFAIAALVLCFACKKEGTTTDTTPISSTDSTSVQQRSQEEAPATIKVKFSGLITHFEGTFQRAVILKVEHHPHQLVIPKTDAVEQALNGMQGADCQERTGACVVVINDMSMQLLGDNQSLASELTHTDGKFESLVLDLADLDPVGFDGKQLSLDAVGPLKKNNPLSWGFFDLRGGDATARAMTCTGHIGSASAPPKDFAQHVKVTYTLKRPVTLRIVDADNQRRDVPLSDGDLLEVNNDVADTNSHFGEYRRISKAAGATLPMIFTDNPHNCLMTKGGIPGCNDTRWSDPTGGK